MVYPPFAVENRVSDAVGQIEIPVRSERLQRRKLLGSKSCPLRIKADSLMIGIEVVEFSQSIKQGQFNKEMNRLAAAYIVETLCPELEGLLWREGIGLSASVDLHDPHTVNVRYPRLCGNLYPPRNRPSRLVSTFGHACGSALCF